MRSFFEVAIFCKIAPIFSELFLNEKGSAQRGKIQYAINFRNRTYWYNGNVWNVSAFCIEVNHVTRVYVGGWVGVGACPPVAGSEQIIPQLWYPALADFARRRIFSTQIFRVAGIRIYLHKPSGHQN